MLLIQWKSKITCKNAYRSAFLNTNSEHKILYCASNENEIRKQLGKEEKVEKKESIGVVNICIFVSIVNMNLNQSYYKTWSEYVCVVKASQSLYIQCN